MMNNPNIMSIPTQEGNRVEQRSEDYEIVSKLSPESIAELYNAYKEGKVNDEELSELLSELKEFSLEDLEWFYENLSEKSANELIDFLTFCFRLMIPKKVKIEFAQKNPETLLKEDYPIYKAIHDENGNNFYYGKYPFENQELIEIVFPESKNIFSDTPNNKKDQLIDYYPLENNEENLDELRRLLAAEDLEKIKETLEHSWLVSQLFLEDLIDAKEISLIKEYSHIFDIRDKESLEKHCRDINDLKLYHYLIDDREIKKTKEKRKYLDIAKGKVDALFENELPKLTLEKKVKEMLEQKGINDVEIKAIFAEMLENDGASGVLESGVDDYFRKRPIEYKITFLREYLEGIINLRKHPNIVVPLIQNDILEDRFYDYELLLYLDYHKQLTIVKDKANKFSKDLSYVTNNIEKISTICSNIERAKPKTLNPEIIWNYLSGADILAIWLGGDGKDLAFMLIAKTCLDNINNFNINDHRRFLLQLLRFPFAKSADNTIENYDWVQNCRFNNLAEFYTVLNRLVDQTGSMSDMVNTLLEYKDDVLSECKQ